MKAIRLISQAPSAATWLFALAAGQRARYEEQPRFKLIRQIHAVQLPSCSTYSVLWDATGRFRKYEIADTGFANGNDTATRLCPSDVFIEVTHALSFVQPGYTTYDRALGVSKDAWNVRLYAQGLTDTLGKVFISTALAIETQTVIRPRVVGVEYGYKF